MLERGRRGAIFGRDLDLAAMERFLDSAPMWPSAIVIEGEASTGTTLCLEAVKPRGHRAKVISDARARSFGLVRPGRAGGGAAC